MHSSLKPVREYHSHTDKVEDTQWHYYTADMFASCGRDKCIKLFDTRENKSEPMIEIIGHD